MSEDEMKGYERLLDALDELPPGQSAERDLLVQASTNARHYLRHVSDGWDGYSLDDASEYTAERLIDFATGAMTYERDLRPLCDEWCEPPASPPGGES